MEKCAFIIFSCDDGCGNESTTIVSQKLVQTQLVLIDPVRAKSEKSITPKSLSLPQKTYHRIPSLSDTTTKKRTGSGQIAIMWF